MITTKKELAKRLASYKPNEKILVLLWTKDEFDVESGVNYESDKPVTKSQWEQAIESVDADSFEEQIREEIISNIEEARQ
jgi:hypothetical protein